MKQTEKLKAKLKRTRRSIDREATLLTKATFNLVYRLEACKKRRILIVLGFITFFQLCEYFENFNKFE